MASSLDVAFEIDFDFDGLCPSSSSYRVVLVIVVVVKAALYPSSSSIVIVAVAGGASEGEGSGGAIPSVIGKGLEREEK